MYSKTSGGNVIKVREAEGRPIVGLGVITGGIRPN